MRRTITGRHSFTGRGVFSNPSGRFDKSQLEEVDDGWYVDETPASIETSVEADTARSIISTNDSPDIGFEQSINPYRGCEHACPYCTAPETPVLMADGSVKPIGKLAIGDDIYGTQPSGAYRRYVRTKVLAKWTSLKPAYRVVLDDGTELIVGAQHRFLTDRGWKFVTGKEQGRDRRPFLTLNNKLLGIGAFARPAYAAEAYERGYLCGLFRGDATLGEYAYPRPRRPSATVYLFRLALCDFDALNRAERFLNELDIQTHQIEFRGALLQRRPMRAIRTNCRDKVRRIRELIEWPGTPDPAWQSGFLAGIFDAEGSYSCGILRITNTDQEIISRTHDALRTLGFEPVVENYRTTITGRPLYTVRLAGGLGQVLKFFHTTDPAVMRKRDFCGTALKSNARLGVIGIEPMKVVPLVDITTGTGDYVSNGVISHNCYARPSHAYLGLSPGLDFETRLFYKPDAARLLEAELANPSYVCKSITLGANTDPYQPVERQMKVTRSILEVLARTRHPVTMITKSALVVRDLDLLSDLARDGLVNVALSITSLDNELKRRMEPRAAAPLARLRALKELTAAGVPGTVMFAPVIPVINDMEMEAVLEASAQAGAKWAGYVLVRLPYEIKDLFREWLEVHYPERAAHVLSVIQNLRGGKLNDPRFGTRMKGEGPFAELLRNRFQIACRRFGLNTGRRGPANTTLFRPPTPPGSQLRLEL
ncbi:MAG: PA0069 family radical SAM protein [Gammaproteobacteria bacterium]|nr:PA0069 family radical SAM protein [Gammaproteobacteria bacterium]